MRERIIEFEQTITNLKHKDKYDFDEIIKNIIEEKTLEYFELNCLKN